MNSTNRFANRFLILVTGLVLLVVGAAGAAAVLVPVVRDAWKDQAGAVDDQIATWVEQTQIGTAGISWITVAGLAVLVLAVILLVVFIVRQGRGHTRVAVTEPTSEHGTTVIEASVAEHALQEAIDGRPEFVASHVSTYRVRRTPVLKVSVTCRRGVSPKDAANIVEDALRALDTLLGRSIPTLIQISGGSRARVTTTTRLQ
ncbi:hypothetical protein [Agromyces atrinae]|uniref:Alkaline shock response membrane anchor protein AmaP n=1 Tax=Agromyces atrinae TaxID=592376 RepID=A0A4Q2M2Q7_9MICO|nr:hypothetical protein [Agromyces atrinae]NYD68720.1 hypothetical protein [Agromyces atrinae]RXZ86079.1 hypothetical protein ESP50_12845 [Agromyces atrinae]